MDELFNIISTVQARDLELEAEKIKLDRAHREALRQQRQSHTHETQLTISELVRKIYKDDTTPAQEGAEALKVPSGAVTNESKPQLDGTFPPPPTGPVQKPA